MQPISDSVKSGDQYYILFPAGKSFVNADADHYPAGTTQIWAASESTQIVPKYVG